MSKYSINNFTSDFAARTRYNNEMIGRFADETLHTYELCEEYASLDYRPFEVTQLMNSLVGLLMLPQGLLTQATIDKKRGAKRYAESIANLVQECGHNRRYNNSFEDTDVVTSFLIHLKRAVTKDDNMGIYFYPLNCGGMEGVSGVIFYDTQDGKEFCVDLLTSEIRSLVSLLSGMYEAMDKKDNPMPEYESEIARLRELMDH